MSNCASMWIAIARTEILRDRGKARAVSTSDWDLRLLREHRETLALDKWDSRAASDFPFIIYLLNKLLFGINRLGLVACSLALAVRGGFSLPWDRRPSVYTPYPCGYSR